MSAAQPPGPADWQRWQTPVSVGWEAPRRTADVVDWFTETVVAAFITTFSAALGAVVGLVWPRLAPHIRLIDAINGSEAASKALLDDDMWLGLLGVVAGVVMVGLVMLTAREAGRGPGATVGLVVGGVVGSLVAAQVGHLVEQPAVTAALMKGFPGITQGSLHQLIGFFGYRARTKAVLLAWPVAAVVLQLVVGLLRDARSTAPTPSTAA